MPICKTPSRCLRGSVALAVLVMVMAAKSGWAQAPPRLETALQQMLAALQTNAYDPFVDQGDPQFKSGFTAKMFADLSRRLGPRLQQGYKTTYLCRLNQQGYVVHVWKLEFKDEGDDHLVSLFTKEGKISGFVPR